MSESATPFCLSGRGRIHLATCGVAMRPETVELTPDELLAVLPPRLYPALPAWTEPCTALCCGAAPWTNAHKRWQR